jgi:hypothetical protein
MTSSTIGILFDQVDQIWPAELREDKIGIRFDQVDQMWPAGTKGDKIRILFDQVYQMWPAGVRGDKIGILFDQVDEMWPVWVRGDKMGFCLTHLTKCDQLGSEETKLGSCLTNLSWPNMTRWGQGGQNWDPVWPSHIYSSRANTNFYPCNKVNNIRPLLDLLCRSWSPNYSVLVSWVFADAFPSPHDVRTPHVPRQAG